MLLIPAIDVRGGRCVRLIQGERGRERVYDVAPVEAARRWVSEGAERLHVVDLDGAFEGRPKHLTVLQEVAAAVSVPIQFGGGLREQGAVAAALGAGAQFVILGTAACRDPGFVREAASRYRGRVLLAIDARDGKVAVSGWEEGTALSPEELAGRFADTHLAGLIFTDIGRDGMMGGVNLEATRRLAREAGRPVFASGGVRSLADIEALRALEEDGVVGAIIGRALYEGKLSLGEALGRVRC
ncbi:MAG: 1-(5-phosphoribosyl)-5-[(5-phosphoribosylamino)methylideneamino]imidazole-4-carboxamide isomerase [Nitrospinota bacterium]